MGYVDIHSHIMPRVDDGSRDTAMTGRMLEIAYNEGIDTVILTPHYKPAHPHVTIDEMRRFADRLSAISRERDWPMDFYIGNELLYHTDCSEKIADGRVATLADSEYVLVEFEPGDAYMRIKSGINELIYAGYRPVLAHAERYACIYDEPAYVSELTDMGCLIQVNAMSVTGDAGRDARALTGKLLKDHLVHFVASDAHSDGRRAPRFRKCADYIARRYGDEYADELMELNGRRIIAGEEI